MKIEIPKLIEGGTHIDERGILSFINDFDLTPVKRFYSITHPNKEIVRAWQGHKQEHKYFYVLKGSFVVAWVKIDRWKSPSKDLKAEYVILQTSDPKILILPPGYANGLKALETNSEIMVFSDYLLNESSDDIIRFNKDWWFDWSQFK
jgi:dTDP-4-dehydrorhamnose 3,5-epimerase-like enzyme